MGWEWGSEVVVSKLRAENSHCVLCQREKQGQLKEGVLGLVCA